MLYSSNKKREMSNENKDIHKTRNIHRVKTSNVREYSLLADIEVVTVCPIV